MAMDAICSLKGLLRHALPLMFAPVTSLFADGCDVIVRYCHQHLSSSQAARRCKEARVCHFCGHRSVWRPRAGVNWLEQIRKFCGELSHALNSSDIFLAAGH